MGKQESENTDFILNAVAPLGIKLFRVQSGSWWASTNQSGMLYRMHGARAGTSDYCGWRKVIITQEMIGKPIAQFVGIEMKTSKGKEGDAQAAFRKIVTDDGGLCAVCKSPEDALTLLGAKQ